MLDVRVEARHWRVRAENAHHQWSERQGRVIRLTDEEGIEGLGEASPLLGYVDETIADVDASLRGLSERLQAPISEDDDPTEAIAARTLDLGSPSVRFALETALWDLWSRRRDVPLAVLWGAKPGARVDTARLVDLLEPAKWPEVPPVVVKVKVGRAGVWAEERAQLRALAARYPKTPVRVDVNRAFDADALPARLDEIAAIGLAIDFIEEPSLAAWPLDAPVRLARDESLRTPGIHLAPAEVAVVKPTVLGGLSTAARWKAETPAVVLSHAFEGPVAHAAASAWAIANAPDVVAGLGLHEGVTSWADIKPHHIEGGRLRVPDRPGLGLSGPGAGRTSRGRS